MSFNKRNRRLKIRKSIRSKLFGTKKRPRVSIFKSNRAIYSQIIDDMNEKGIDREGNMQYHHDPKIKVQNSKVIYDDECHSLRIGAQGQMQYAVQMSSTIILIA